MPDRFHLNGHIKGFGPQPHMLAKPYDTSSFTLSYIQDSTARSVFSRNVIPLSPEFNDERVSPVVYDLKFFACFE